jgi:hypothetical protein
MRHKATAILAAMALAALSGAGLSGCIARTVVGVVTAPVRVAGKAVDLTTTSQSEAERAELDRSYRAAPERR